MSQLILSELYTSVQGEGNNTGRMTQFVRFAGCNMRCPGWPCDTEHAINPAIWRHEAQRLSPHQLFKMLPEYPKHLCLTGGEPFLQDTTALQEFCEYAWAANYTIECFTNGSFDFPAWARMRMTFMMDWKLAGSGEATTQVQTRGHNALRLKVWDGIKFVVTNLDDLEEARALYFDLINQGVECEFWVAQAWGHDEADIDMIMEYLKKFQLPWRVNVQVHKYLWPADARGV